MNIKENLTCKCCNKVFYEPIALTCCGESMCKQHINELLSIDDSNTFSCPFCDKQNPNQNIEVSKTIQYLIDIEAHKFTIDPKYERVLNNFKTEIRNLERILNEPESFIKEKINQLKVQVDLDREKTKSEIDRLADDMIKQLEAFDKQFIEEYNDSYVDLKYFISIFVTSNQQLADYEKFLSLLSTKAEERVKKRKESENLITNLQSNIEELKENLFSNISITYKPVKNKIQDLYGKLIIKNTKNNKEILGTIQKELKGHNGIILSLAVLPNGDLVSGAWDNTIKIWNTNDGTVKQTLLGHTGWIRDLIAIDNNCLISASGDGTIKIWNINEGTARITLIGHTESVLTLIMLKNGDLASGSADRSIKIWNINDISLKKNLKEHTGSVWSLVLLKNGDLVSGSLDNTIKIWDVDSWLVKRTLSGHTSHVYTLALLGNGDLVSGSDDNTIKIWNIEDGTIKRTLTGHNSNVFALKVLNNREIVSGSKDGTIKIWNVKSGVIKKDITVNAKVNSFEVLQNGDLVSASDQSIIIWD